MAKRCGFCAFESEDEGAFRAHLADAHGWGRAARGVTVDREKVGREYVLERIVDLVVKNRLPAMYPNSEYVETGGLMFYVVDLVVMFCHFVIYVDKSSRARSPLIFLWNS